MRKILLPMTLAALLICFAVAAFAGVQITPEEVKTLERVTVFNYCDAVGDVNWDGQLEPADARLIRSVSVVLRT